MTIGFLGGKRSVETCQADAPQTSLCSPVARAAEEELQPRQGAPGLARQPEATARLLEPTPRQGKTGHLLRLIVGPGAARQVEQLLWSSLLPP